MEITRKMWLLPGKQNKTHVLYRKCSLSALASQYRTDSPRKAGTLEARNFSEIRIHGKHLIQGSKPVAAHFRK